MLNPIPEIVAPASAQVSRLLAVRRALNVTRLELAAAAGVSIGTVWNAETGTRRTTRANRAAIAAALNVPVETIWPEGFDKQASARRADVARRKVEPKKSPGEPGLVNPLRRSG